MNGVKRSIATTDRNCFSRTPEFPGCALNFTARWRWSPAGRFRLQRRDSAKGDFARDADRIKEGAIVADDEQRAIIGGQPCLDGFD